MTEELVWDTSSLSHALEEYAHSAISAYMAVRKKMIRRKYFITWDMVRKALLRRHRSEYESRKLLTLCDNITYSCYIPEEVLNEMKRAPRLFHSAQAVLNPIAIEEEYIFSNPLAEGFSRYFRPRLSIARAPSRYIRIVKKAIKTYGIKIHYADMYALALAMARNATLVTGDRNLAELARLLGVKVRYTLGLGKKGKQVGVQVLE